MKFHVLHFIKVFFSIFSDKENPETKFQMDGQSNPILKIYQNF